MLRNKVLGSFKRGRLGNKMKLCLRGKTLSLWATIPEKLLKTAFPNSGLSGGAETSRHY